MRCFPAVQNWGVVVMDMCVHGFGEGGWRGGLIVADGFNSCPIAMRFNAWHGFFF